MNDMPPLREHVGHLHSNGEFCQDRNLGNGQGWPQNLYTAEQMHAYAQSYADGRVRELEKALRIGNDALVSAVRDMGAAQDRAEAAEKDAARYRWLRNGLGVRPEDKAKYDAGLPFSVCVTVLPGINNDEPRAYPICLTALDAAIDRAMEQK